MAPDFMEKKAAEKNLKKKKPEKENSSADTNLKLPWNQILRDKLAKQKEAEKKKSEKRKVEPQKVP